MKKRFFLLISLILFSCTTSYICESSYNIPIYSKKTEKSDTLFMVPINTKVFVIGKSKKFKKIIYKDYEGWTNSNNLKYVSKKSIVKEKNTAKHNNTSSYSSEGTVKVKGYYRKNGTYVKPHTRSSPKSYKRK